MKLTKLRITLIIDYDLTRGNAAENLANTGTAISELIEKAREYGEIIGSDVDTVREVEE